MSDAPLTLRDIQDRLSRANCSLEIEDGRIKVGQRTTVEDIWVNEQDLVGAQIIETATGSGAGMHEYIIVLRLGNGQSYELCREKFFGDA